MSTIQPTKEQTLKAQEDIVKAAESPEAIKALGEDIEKATKEVANTLENFKQVHSKLLEIDRRNLVADKFAPQWKTLYEQYYDILALSKTHASSIAAFGESFDVTTRKYGDPNYRFDSGKDVPASARIKLIENALKITEEFQTNAGMIEKKIDDLQSGLSDIAASLNPNRFAKKEEAELKKEMEDLLTRIEEIKTEIGEVDDKIADLANKLNVAEIGEGIAKAVIPIYGLILLAAGTKSFASGLQQELEDLKQSRKDKETEQAEVEQSVEKIKETLSQIAEARVALKDVQGRITNIRDALKFFAQVWAGIKGSSDQILVFLKNNTFKDQDFMALPEMFIDYAKHPRTYYSALSIVLSKFATGLGNYTEKPVEI